ncbi:larval cuticle protein 65Ag1-like [Macrosteles quadrilineatus]|uniref:larval cuticle protein 65Ag1-like n=1 Tax=Macrosteles quadrilineatus TaxID=74068 RepID=UPI0023E23119|nr:larval cuticle protein 65Ag1-like [Macrosteles quadrilineatus]
MKTILCLCAVVATAVAFPQTQVSRAAQVAPVIQRTEFRDTSGQISESYSTHDGQHFQERGILKPTADGKDYVLVKTGSYQFITPEGQNVRTDWQADENGFHAQGNHLPVAPEAAPPAAAPAPAFF